MVTVTVRVATVSVSVTRVSPRSDVVSSGPGASREPLTGQEAAHADGHEQDQDEQDAQPRMAALAHRGLAAALDAQQFLGRPGRRRWRQRAQAGVQSRALRAARAQAASAKTLSWAQPIPGATRWAASRPQRSASA